MTRVVNKYKENYDVYIGRGSKWGNPFVIGKDGNRQEVINKYREWIIGQKTLDDIQELSGKVLGCYCHPLPCHGDVLIELLEKHNKQEKVNE